MSNITTLDQFLSEAKAQFHIYDLGRRVQLIDKSTFKKIEQLNQPYPYPIQGHGQFAVVFWTDSAQPFIWFLKLPLDEQGFLSPSATSQFMTMIIEALGQNITKELVEKEQQKLANHAFSFKPTEEKLAVFNALVRKALNAKLSKQYQYAADYLQGNINKDDWQGMGLQGIADICVKLDDSQHLAMINYALSLNIKDLSIALCQCLELIEIPDTLGATLFNLFKTCDQENTKSYYFRALASQPKYTIKTIEIINSVNAFTPNILIIIAARNWIALTDANTLKTYFEALAKQSPQMFNQVFADLVAIPLLRQQLLCFIRQPERSVQLSDAIGGLFRAIKS